MNILILGGYGQTGSLIARHLLERTNNRVTIAGRDEEKARALKETLKSDRVTALQVDARNATSLKTALTGMHLVIVACPTSDQTELVAKAALDSRVDYLDVQLSEAKLGVLRSLKGRILAEDRCFITEAGYHPGLPSALVRYAALGMDRPESAVLGGFINMHGDLPYTEAVSELTELFLHYPSEVYIDGRWTPPGSWAQRRLDFGPGIGRRAAYSWCLEELRDLPQMYPSLRQTGLYLASTGWAVDAFTMAMMLALKVLPHSTHQSIGRALWWGMTQLAPPPYGVVLQVEAEGQGEGRRVKRLLRLSHADGYEFTAIPVAALLMQFDQVRKPGLHYMGHLCEPRRLVDDMQAMGIERVEEMRAENGTKGGQT